jgi:GAF domain-containing protein
VKRRPDVIDQMTDLVVGSDDPRRLTERTIEVAMSLTNGRAGAVFVREGDRVTLFASRGIDQQVLDAIQGLWGRHRESLERGETFYVPDRASDRRLEGTGAAPAVPASLAVVPVLDRGEILALLYVDSLDPRFCAPRPRQAGEVLADRR